MTDFILVWVLMAFDPSHGALTYSPPVKTLEDCKRMQKFVDSRSDVFGANQCVQINILKKASEK